MYSKKTYPQAEKFLSEHPDWTVDDALDFFEKLEKKEKMDEESKNNHRSKSVSN